MKTRIVRFVAVFAYFFVAYYIFTTDRNIWYFIFVSTMFAIVDAFTYKYFHRFITNAVKKIIKQQ